MLRKVFITGCILLIVLTLIACGGSGKETSSSLSTVKTTQSPATTVKTTTMVPAVTSTKKTTPTGASFDDVKTTTQPSELTEKASLPEDYPEDIFPIYAGSQISEVMGSGNSYSVVAYSDASFSEVLAFYKNVLKNAKVMSQTEESDHFESFGTKGDYTYTLAIGETSEYKGFKTEIWLTFYK